MAALQGDTVTAKREGTTREFSKTQWDLMGKDKQGWEVASPDELNADAKLDAARNEYKSLFGKDAPANASADFISGQIAGFKAFQAQAGAAASTIATPTSTDAATADQTAKAQVGELQAEANANIADQQEANGQVAAVNGAVVEGAAGEDADVSVKSAADQQLAADYRKPRSTEKARDMYSRLFGKDADEDASYSYLVGEIEHKLGVAHGEDGE